jgi:hypothetical protein
MAGAADRSIAAVVPQIAALRSYTRRSVADSREMRRSAAACCSSTNVLPNTHVLQQKHNFQKIPLNRP